MNYFEGRTPNILLVFMSQSYFKVPKDIRINVPHSVIMKIPSKKELQQIASSHSSIPRNHFYLKRTIQIDHQIIHQDFGKAYNKMTVKENIKTTDNKIEQNKAQYNFHRD